MNGIGDLFDTVHLHLGLDVPLAKQGFHVGGEFGLYDMVSSMVMRAMHTDTLVRARSTHRLSSAAPRSHQRAVQGTVHSCHPVGNTTINTARRMAS